MTTWNKRIWVLLEKVGLDGHDRGVKVAVDKDQNLMHITIELAHAHAHAREV